MMDHANWLVQACGSVELLCSAPDTFLCAPEWQT